MEAIKIIKVESFSPDLYTQAIKNFMASFYGWGSTDSRLEPLRGGSLLFTTKSPEIPKERIFPKINFSIL